MTDKIRADIFVSEAKSDFFGNFFSVFGAKKTPEEPIGKNQVEIVVYKKIGNSRVVFVTGKGNYARHLEINGVFCYPNPKIDFPIWHIETKGPLTVPSSSVVRKDILLLAEGKPEEADK